MPRGFPCRSKATPPNFFYRDYCWVDWWFTQRLRMVLQNTPVILVPAPAAVPAAAAKKQNNNYNDEKRGGIHL
jgi:hypothetical protein